MIRFENTVCTCQHGPIVHPYFTTECTQASKRKTRQMSVIVRYFAGLREQMGRQEDKLDAGSCATVAEVWKEVSGREQLPDNLLSAVNLEYVASDHPVKDGDEVAFFPPVTGG